MAQANRTLYGVARVNGIDGSAAITSLWTNGGQVMTGASLKDATKVERLEVNGTIIGFSKGERILSLTIDFIPTGGASAANTIANAKLACVLPTGPVKVTLAGFYDGSTAQVNGDWIYESDDELKRGDGDTVMTLPLIKPSTSATTLTTAVS